MTSNGIWTAGLLPKSETQAADFVRQNPNFDGRGIIVGVLDTGCDPGAIGLSMTSEGLPKIIDIVDCGGSGDVIMGPWMTPEKGTDGGLKLVGMTGRTLQLNPSWTNPTGKYRLGYKRAIELYPRGLKERVKEQRKKQWMEMQRKLESQLQKELVQATASGVADDIEECKVRIAQLRQLEKDNNDECGPLYDCLVFYDGYVTTSNLYSYVCDLLLIVTLVVTVLVVVIHLHILTHLYNTFFTGNVGKPSWIVWRLEI